MEALHRIQKITSNQITIKDLDRFYGKEVKITITPLEKEAETPPDTIKSVRGRLKKYADTSLIHQEKSAWKKAVEEKHEDM